MKRFILEQFNDEFHTSHSGLALAGLCLNYNSNLSQLSGRKIENNGKLISNIDILKLLGPSLNWQERLRGYNCHARRQ